MESTQGTENIRQQISRDVSRAIDSSVNYSGEEYALNRHNWVQITTDRTLSAVMQSLPPPVDLRAKYELSKGQTFPEIRIEPDMSAEEVQRNIDLLAKFAEDRGYNQYFWEYADYLRSLYMADDAVVQSEHDDSKIRSQQEDTDQSDHQEPSEVR